MKFGGVSSLLLILWVVLVIISNCSSSSKGYDENSAQFDPEGRLIQLEYAKRAIREYGGLMFAAKTKHGIIFYSSAKNKKSSKLVLNSLSQKVLKLHDRLLMSTSGLAIDSTEIRKLAEQLTQKYHEDFLSPIPLENLCEKLSETLHEMTTKGPRPVAIKILLAGIVENKELSDDIQYKIVSIEPEGSYYSWKAIAIGENEDSTNEKLIGLMKDSDQFEAQSISQTIQLIKDKVISTQNQIEDSDTDWKTSQVYLLTNQLVHRQNRWTQLHSSIPK